MAEDINLTQVAEKLIDSLSKVKNPSERTFMSIARSLTSDFPTFTASDILKRRKELIAEKNKKTHKNVVKPPKYHFIGARFFRKATGGLLGPEGLGNFGQDLGLNQD